MPKPQAMVDYKCCRAEVCNQGICPAIAVCERKVLTQDQPKEPPYSLGHCTGCGMCVVECPYQAIKLG